MNNKKLLLIFLALLVIFLTSQFIFERQPRSFKADLIQIDTTKVTSISIFPKSDNQQEVLLKKEGDNWIANKGSITTKANPGSVLGFLGNVHHIKAERVVSKSEDKWKEYEVEEGNGTRIKIFADKKLLEEFIVGRFNFNQQTRQGISYIRLAGEKEVYAVDGFISMTLGQGFEAYRNKDLLQININDLTKIAIKESQTEQIYQKLGNTWSLNGTPVDSAKVDNYLTGLQSIFGSEFVDDFDELKANEQLVKTLTLEGNNMLEPIVIRAYRDSTREKPFIIHSTMNKESYFQSDSSGVFSSLFKVSYL